MNLKESFRYQNYLENLFQQVQMYLQDTGNLVKVSQEHLRKNANPEAENETIDGSKERIYEHDNNTIIEFMLAIVEEKHDLAVAIGKAKASCVVDIDAEVSSNRLRHTAATLLQRIGGIKSGERKTGGNDRKFNINGDQVVYYYDIKETTTIDFDRNKVKRLSKDILRVADSASTAIDRCMIDVEVVFTPMFAVDDTIEDALAAYVEHMRYVRHAV